jgi:hypothetical protein
MHVLSSFPSLVAVYAASHPKCRRCSAISSLEALILQARHDYNLDTHGILLIPKECRMAMENPTLQSGEDAMTKEEKRSPVRNVVGRTGFEPATFAV